MPKGCGYPLRGLSIRTNSPRQFFVGATQQDLKRTRRDVCKGGIGWRPKDQVSNNWPSTIRSQPRELVNFLDDVIVRIDYTGCVLEIPPRQVFEVHIVPTYIAPSTKTTQHSGQRTHVPAATPAPTTHGAHAGIRGSRGGDQLRSVLGLFGKGG